MCGRYTLAANLDEVMDEFELSEPIPLSPRYNIAPTQPAIVVRPCGEPAAGRREGSFLRWGLVPSWSRDASGAARLINARSETAATQPAFRAAFKRRRCLVPCSGFYEWERIETGGKPRKFPHYFHPARGPLFGLAGLWERWEPPDGSVLESFAILTTRANGLLSRIHDRMPVIIGRDDYAAWLDAATDPARLASLMEPCDERSMTSHRVDPRMNNPRVDDPACIAATV